MGYRQSNHGIRSLSDTRDLFSKCSECDWSLSLTLINSSETKDFYRQTKDHVQATGHLVNLCHSHEVTYVHRPKHRW